MEVSDAHLQHSDKSQESAALTGWSANRLAALAVLLCVMVANVDALLGRHVILIGLLIVGPCCATLTGNWRRIALVGAWAVALAVVTSTSEKR